MDHAVNWEAISAIGQIVGAFAVVISLIYLAREIRSNARAARTASMGNVNRWLGELVVNPHLGELWYRGIHDFGSLKNGDLVRFSVLMVPARETGRNSYVDEPARSWSHHDRYWIGQLDSRRSAGPAGREGSARAVPRIANTGRRCDDGVDRASRRPRLG